jgi:5-formaminoimidazole-4-carboxamide-1-(beta)-D-ribofuranosyl 5'-monophosphate synthetase
MAKRNLDSIMDEYDVNNLSLVPIGSHSALDICTGAQELDIPNCVVAEKGREKTYTEAFIKRKQGRRVVGSVQEVHVVDAFNEMAEDDVVEWIREKNGIVVPSRSLAVYLRNKKTEYDPILKMETPFLGNIHLLQAEERAKPYLVKQNQDFLAEKANLPIPLRFESPEEIDRPSLIKASKFSEERDFERDFHIVNSAEEYYTARDEVVSDTPDDWKDTIKKEFESAPIQEYFGKEGLINLNFFNSKVWNDLEILGTDTRTQFPNGEEYTHLPNSLRESLYEQAWKMGKDLVKVIDKKFKPKGLIGSFAIQCMGDKNEKLRPIDLSLRIPGSPDTGITPPAYYLHKRRMDFGRRIALEIKDAVEQNALHKILS